MTRKEQQQDLIYQLGLWLRPVMDVVESPNTYSAEERANIRARAYRDGQAFTQAVHAFCHNVPGHTYVMEHQVIRTEIDNLIGSVNSSLVDAPQSLASCVEHLRPQIVAGIVAVPVSSESSMFEAQTPFTTYCRVKALCETTGSMLIYTDRYLDKTVFHRYLAAVPEQTEITLVTWPRSRHHNKRRYDEFIDVSHLFAQERGPDKYRLFVEETFHDRWLRCDDQLFHLGGSIKDAGNSSVYTLSKIDSTPDNMKKLNDLIAAGTELFGPSNQTQP